MALTHIKPLTNTDDDVIRTRHWSCYGCGQLQDKVLYLRYSGSHDLEFLCPDCLFEAVASGRLIAINPAQLAEAKGVTAVAPPPAQPPVIVDDDGSMSVEGTQINWD